MTISNIVFLGMAEEQIYVDVIPRTREAEIPKAVPSSKPILDGVEHINYLVFLALWKVDEPLGAALPLLHARVNVILFGVVALSLLGPHMSCLRLQASRTTQEHRPLKGVWVSRVLSTKVLGF